MKRTIVSMPGDGIGKTVLPEAIKVLNAVKFEADYVHGDIGWDFGAAKEMHFHSVQLNYFKNTKLLCLVQSLPNQKMLLIKNLIQN
ncbi:MAG: hypothetical protein M5T52_02130 [Ignavibacteriaceae bacterium]|nr:hypothetical protein [Ignavibacteriaceae bacterium]